MEELVEAVLAGVEEAKSRGITWFVYTMPQDSEESNVTLESLVQARLPTYSVNHMTIRRNTITEKLVIVDW